MGLKKMDDRGQSNIDFLFGLGVFLVTFIYAVTFIPGLFVPYQSSAIDLSSVAYRTAAILVEDPGWYIYNGSSDIYNGSGGLPNWEDLPDSQIMQGNDSELARIGLADNSMDKSTPNQLSIKKISKFNNASLINYTWARDRIGLNGSVIYDFNVNVTMYDTMNGQTYEVLNRTSQNQSNTNIESIERPVMVDTGEQLFIDVRNPNDLSGNPQTNTMWIDLSTLTDVDRNNNITIRLYNVSTVSGDVTLDALDASPTYMDIGTSIDPASYNINISGYNVADPMGSIVFNSTSVVEITINSAVIAPGSGVNYIVIKTDKNVLPEQLISYDESSVFPLKPVLYPGLFRLEVWTYGIAQ